MYTPKLGWEEGGTMRKDGTRGNTRKKKLTGWDLGSTHKKSKHKNVQIDGQETVQHIATSQMGGREAVQHVEAVWTGGQWRWTPQETQIAQHGEREVEEPEVPDVKTWKTSADISCH